MTLIMWKITKRPKKSEYQLRAEASMAALAKLVMPMECMAESMEQANKGMQAFADQLIKGMPRNVRRRKKILNRKYEIKTLKETQMLRRNK